MAACWPLQMPPTQKAVLISLADNANDQGYCWPSIATISQRTCFGKTAVIEAIKWLEEGGYLSAERHNGRHTAYLLNLSNLSVCRTGSGNAPVRETDMTCPADGPHLSASRTTPVRQTDTNHKEPSLTVIKSNRHKRAQAPAVELPEWLPEKNWGEWLEHRRLIKKPMSPLAEKLAIDGLTKFRARGLDPVHVIHNAIVNGWQGLYAPSVDKSGEKYGSHQPVRRLSAAERAEQYAREGDAADDRRESETRRLIHGL